MKKRILVLCTGNSCRSQMAEGFLKSFDGELEVYSAGTHPAARVHPLAVRVMKEKSIDISGNRTKNAAGFVSESFDYVITVCDNARETCPFFTGKVLHRVHMGFEDPAEATGSEEAVLAVFRRVRDQIMEDFSRFYFDELRGA